MDIVSGVWMQSPDAAQRSCEFVYNGYINVDLYKAMTMAFIFERVILESRNSFFI